MLLGVDVGGTFTDAVLFDGGGSTPPRRRPRRRTSRAACSTRVEAALERAGAPAATVEAFAHGMTVGTNALLEERGARTALVATDGFADLLDIARQNRPDLYRLCAPKPAPLVAPRAALRGRGAHRPRGGGRAARRRGASSGWPRRSARAAPSRWRSACSSPTSTPRTSGASPSACARSFPASTSPPRTRSCPSFASTSAARPRSIDAYLSPLLGRYLERLGGGGRGRGLPEPLVMQSSGGVAPAAEAARAGAWSVLSGPAGGAVGAGLLAAPRATATRSASTWAEPPATSAWSRTGEVRRTDSREIGGPGDPAADGRRPHRRRRRRLDRLARRRRRPSGRARARRAPSPGPPVTGAAATEPTVTDANLLLGYLDADSSLAGGVELDAEAAAARGPPRSPTRSDSASWRRPRGSSGSPTRRWCARCASSPSSAASTRATSRCCRSAAPGRCTPPRSPTSSASSRILCPRAGGVLSALGLIASERRRDTARTVLLERRGADAPSGSPPRSPS